MAARLGPPPPDPDRDRRLHRPFQPRRRTPRRDTFGIYRTMVDSTILNGGSFQQVILRAVPVGLAAIAVSVPARAGLVNVGGEGQLILGAVAATGVGVPVGASVPAPSRGSRWAPAGAVGGAVWAGISGVLRVTGRRERGGDDPAPQLHRERPDAVPDLPAVARPDGVRPAAVEHARRRRAALKSSAASSTSV